MQNLWDSIHWKNEHNPLTKNSPNSHSRIAIFAFSTTPTLSHWNARPRVYISTVHSRPLLLRSWKLSKSFTFSSIKIVKYKLTSSQKFLINGILCLFSTYQKLCGSPFPPPTFFFFFFFKLIYWFIFFLSVYGGDWYSLASHRVEGALTSKWWISHIWPPQVMNASKKRTQFYCIFSCWDGEYATSKIWNRINQFWNTHIHARARAHTHTHTNSIFSNFSNILVKN